MQLHWFPGHMTKSLRMMEDMVKLIDIIIYVLDARAPYSCINPAFEPIIGTKPIIFVLNKSDMVGEKDVSYWQNRLKTIGSEVVALNSIMPKSSFVLAALAKRLCGEKLERQAKRGIKTTIRAMVIGVPNCGKSTLINNMCGSARAVTGNKAGVTRGKQWVKINDYFEVLDTPGTLYPKLADKQAARRLAFIGSIKDEVVDINELALELLKELIALDKKLVENRYKITVSEDYVHIMSDIAKGRGFIIRGGVVDFDRVSVAIIDDFRKGKMGKICLDRE